MTTKTTNVETPLPMVTAQPLPSNAVIPWNVAVMCLDGIYGNPISRSWIGKLWGSQYERMIARPLKEVERFARATSRIQPRWTFIPFNDPHGYSGPTARGEYWLYWNVLPQKWIDLIPADSDSVLCLYKLGAGGIYREPLQVGSTWHLNQGIVIPGGKRVVFSSIPVDDADFTVNPPRFPWNTNEPFQGFNDHRGQIATHECLVNAVSGTLENAPYCPPCHRLDGVPGAPAWEYEKGRIQQIDAACYQVLGNNED